MGIRGIAAEMALSSKPDQLTVTDAIALAMENADEMATVVILYEGKDGTGFITDGSVDLKTANFLADSLKAWIMSKLADGWEGEGK